MSNIKDVDLPRHARDTHPFPLIVSPTPPVQSLDAYVRTYVRSDNHVFENGALSHAREASLLCHGEVSVCLLRTVCPHKYVRVCAVSLEQRRLSSYHWQFFSVPSLLDGRMNHFRGFSSLYIEV